MISSNKMVNTMSLIMRRKRFRIVAIPNDIFGLGLTLLYDRNIMFSIISRLNANNGSLSKENTNAIYEHGYVDYLVCQDLKCEHCSSGYVSNA